MNTTVLFVYYKVPATAHAAWVPQVQQFQAALQQAWPGLVVELMQRPEATAGIETWMETYRHPSGITAKMSASIEQAAATASLPVPRHVERFVVLY
jgi:hypothetical protein